MKTQREVAMKYGVTEGYISQVLKSSREELSECFNKHGVNFIRSRVHTINPVGDSGDLEVRYVKEDGSLVVDVFDLSILSVGM